MIYETPAWLYSKSYPFYTVVGSANKGRHSIDKLWSLADSRRYLRTLYRPTRIFATGVAWQHGFFVQLASMASSIVNKIMSIKCDDQAWLKTEQFVYNIFCGQCWKEQYGYFFVSLLNYSCIAQSRQTQGLCRSSKIPILSTRRSALQALRSLMSEIKISRLIKMLNADELKNSSHVQHWLFCFPCFPCISFRTPSCWRIQTTGCECNIDKIAVLLFQVTARQQCAYSDDFIYLSWRNWLFAFGEEFTRRPVKTQVRTPWQRKSIQVAH